MYCICCKKNIVKPHDVKEEDVKEEDLIWDENRAIDRHMVDDGIIHIINAGYGSKHDGDQFIIAICDDCISENLRDQTLLYYGNYMDPDNQFTKTEIEKSKKLYRRRKNLDELI
jgi:hypothetical protein